MTVVRFTVLRNFVLPLVIILLSAICTGCGDGEPTTLEIHLQNLDAIAGQDLTVIVRVNGTERPRMPPQEVLSVAVDAGVVNVGIDFTNGAGEVKFSGPHELAIAENQIEILQIDLREIFPPVEDCPLCGCVEVSQVPFHITERNVYTPLDPEGKNLKTTGGKGTAELGSIIITDCETGARKGEITASSDYIQGNYTFSFDAAEKAYKGNLGGDAIIYLKLNEKREVIFKGFYITDSPDDLRAVIDPAGNLIEFVADYRLKTFGEGIYASHILEGTARSELKGPNELEGGFFVISLKGEVKHAEP